MSTVKATASQIKMLEEVLDDDHASLTAAARAVWDAVADLVLERANFALVAQLVGTTERPKIEPSDPESIKVVLAYYATAGEAQKAAESVAWQPQTGDQWRAWVVPVWHLGPAELTKKRREKLEATEAKRDEKRRESFRASIEARQIEANEMAAALNAVCTDTSHAPRIGPKGAAYCPDCEAEQKEAA